MVAGLSMLRVLHERTLVCLPCCHASFNKGYNSMPALAEGVISQVLLLASVLAPYPGLWYLSIASPSLVPRKRTPPIYPVSSFSFASHLFLLALAFLSWFIHNRMPLFHWTDLLSIDLTASLILVLHRLMLFASDTGAIEVSEYNYHRRQT